MTEQNKGDQKVNELLAVAKKVVSLLEQEGVTQGEALVVFSLAKNVLHHQPVKLPQTTDDHMWLGNYVDNYPLNVQLVPGEGSGQ